MLRRIREEKIMLLTKNKHELVHTLYKKRLSDNEYNGKNKTTSDKVRYEKRGGKRIRIL